jgi:subtilisin family serine protease
MGRIFVKGLLYSLLTASAVWAGDGQVRRAAEPIRGSYIVVLDGRDSMAVANRAGDLARRLGGRVTDTWQHALHGFVAQLTEQQAQALSRDPHVLSVEEDGIVHTISTENTGIDLWNLDRIDQRSGRNGSYSWCQDGTGVKIYVVDTGIFSGNIDFAYGRVLAGPDYVESPSGDTGHSTNPCKDLNDPQRFSGGRAHGTTVASVAAGVTYGVAKNAMLVAIRSFNCAGLGSASLAVAGINWAVRDHQAGQPAVLNMSFAYNVLKYSAGDLSAIDYAVNGAIDDGIVAVAGAGNDNTLACNSSPQRVPRVITVGGSDIRDQRWVDVSDPNSFPRVGSNYGSCIDLFAPADGISGAGIDNITQVLTNQEGTSFSGPIVAGVAAQYLQLHPSATPDEVSAWLISQATPGVLTEGTYSPLGNSPNLLVYSSCQ